MSKRMRAKLVISNVESFPKDDQQVAEFKSERITFRAVYRNEGYSEDGADENNTYAIFTPMFDATMTLNNPALIGQYKIGDTFYVNFTPVDNT